MSKHPQPRGQSVSSARSGKRQRPARRSLALRLEELETRINPNNVDVLGYHNDNFLTGQNLRETTLTPANVNATSFGTLFRQPIDGQAYAQPLYKANLVVPGVGTRNVAFVATEHDSVYAFDTDSNTGASAGPLWHRVFIDPAHGITTIPYQELSTPDILPEIGITGTPVIDGTTNTLYVLVKTREVRGTAVHYVQNLHALDLATGADKFGGPYLVGDTVFGGPDGGFTNTTAIYVNGTGGGAGPDGKVRFNAAREADRMALQLVGNVVYIAFSSHADYRPYHGWVLGFDKTTLQPVKVFNTAPNADGGGIWQSGGGISVDAQGNLYFALGNAFNDGTFPGFDPAHGNYSESVLKLDPTPTWSPANPQMMRVVSYFTPNDWRSLDDQDADLGSGGAILLPDGVGSAAHPRLIVETGKSGKIYLMDRDNLGGYTPGGPDAVVQTTTAGQAGVWGNPSFFQINATTGILYYHGSGDVLKGYYVSNGHIEDGSRTGDRPILRSNFNSHFPGTQPVISADGTVTPTTPANGIVWEIQVDNAVGRIQGVADFTTAGPATLRAFNPTNPGVELYDSAQMGQRDFFGGAVKFTVPVVTNGHVLIGTADYFSVLGLFAPATAAPAAPSNLSVVLRPTSQGPQIVLNWTNPAPSAGGTADPTGIKILRSTDGVTFAPYNTVARNQTSFTDVGPLEFGRRYYYQVVANNQRGDSGPSNTVNVLVPIASPVLTLTGVTSSTIELNWTPVANDHYDIERSVDGITFTRLASVSAFQTYYTDVGLSGTPRYTYRIHAFNSNPTAESLSNLVSGTVGPVLNHGTPPVGGFTNPTDVTTNGDAFIGTENLLRLTNAVNQTGSLFSNTRFAVAQFSTSFQVRLHEGTQPNYADGFTFVLQANSPTALGQGGSGLGYQGIGHSIAVKFSPYQHTGDPSNSSVGLVLNGADPGGGVSTIPSGVLLNNQDIKQIDLTYNGTTLTVRIENILTHSVFTTSFAVNVPQVLGSDTAYAGFTGSSGSGTFWELEDVLSWTFTSQATVPGAPANLRVTTSASSELDLTWDGNSHNETGFAVERSRDGVNFAEVARTTTTSYRDFGLAPGAYFYRVRAFNAAGNSPYSATLATSLAAPILTIDQDVGTPGDPGIAGHASYANGAYTLTASGSDVWDTTDHFHFLYLPFVGDGEIVARVVSEGIADPSTKAGVMFRESLATGAKNAYVLEFPNAGRNGPTFQYRNATDAQTQEHLDGTVSSPLWLRLVRSGNTFTGYWAFDTGGGTHGAWNQLGAETFVMRPDVFLGLAVTSHNNGTTISATFDNVQILPAAQQASHLDVHVAVSAVNPGSAFTVTVQALDQYNNPVPGYRGTVHFASSDSMAGLPTDYMFTATDAGSHTFMVTLRTLGRQTITVADTAAGIVSGGTALTVTTNLVPGSILVAGFPASVHVGGQGAFTVTIRDAGGATLTAYRGTVHFTSTDPRAVLPADYTFTATDAGVHTFPLTLNTLGTQSITATDVAVGVAGTEANIAVVSPPVITSVNRSAFAINEGDRITLNGLFRDLATGQTHTVTIVWGDGSANTTLPLAAGTFAFTANHQYQEEGNFDLRITVQAADGSSDALTLAVNAAAVAVPSGLVAWWTGDGSGPIATDIAGTNPATLNGGVTYAPAKVGNGFRFDGSSSSYVEIPNAAALNSTTGTWDFWFQTSQPNAYIGLVGKSDVASSNNGITMQIGPNGEARIEIKANGPTLLLDGNTRLNDGQFHHMALTFQSGGTSIMYVDGQVQATGTAPAFTFSTLPMRFGTMVDSFWTPLNGILDEVQVFNRVLSAGEIQSIVAAGSAGQVKGVRAADPAVVATGGFTYTAIAGVGQSPRTVATFTDPGGPEALADYSAQINWGDTTAPTAGTITFNAGTGVFTVQGSHVYAQQGNYTITVTLRHDTAAVTTVTDPAQVAALVVHFVVGGFPSPTTAGTPGTFTVTAQDQTGTTFTGYSGRVHFSSSDPQAALPADATLTNGTGSFSATLKTAGTQSITATDAMTAAFTGTQSGIVVTPAAASVFALTGLPSAWVSGDIDGFIVSVRDAYGNAVSGYRGTVHFTSSDANARLPRDYTFTAADAGQHVFGAQMVTVGGDTLTVTDTSPGGFGSTQTVLVSPAYFTISGPPAITAGQIPSYTVTAYDALGNVGTGYRGTVHFTSSDPQAVLPTDTPFTAADNGSRSFPVTLKTAGTQTVTATDAASPASTGSVGVQVSPAAANRLVLSRFPSLSPAGTFATLTVTALDPYGNVATGYTGTVHVSTTDPQGYTDPDHTYTSDDGGVYYFVVGLFTAGNWTISATDGTRSDAQSVTVTPGAVATFVVTGFPSSITAGTAATFTVTAQDLYGNVVTGYSGHVHFTSSDPQATLPADATLTNGTGSFSATLKTAGSQSITASDSVSPTISGSQFGIQVNAAAATHLSIAGFPSPAVAGTVAFVTVTAYDAYGNVATGYTGTVHLTSNDPQAYLDPDHTYTTADAGVYSFVVGLYTAGSRTIIATDLAAPLLTATQTVTVTPGAAYQLVVTGLPASVTAGTPLTFTVTARDVYGNTATDYTGPVHFSSSDPQAVLPADATLTGGTGSFSVTFKTAGTQGLEVDDLGGAIFSGFSNPVQVNAAALFAFQVSGYPSPVSAGTVNSFTVTAIDAYGNTVTNYTGRVHISSSDGAALLPADYTFTAGDGGSHTFDAVLMTTGTQSLTATDTVMSSITGTESGIVVM